MADLTRMDRDAVTSVMLDAGGTEVENNGILARAKALRDSGPIGEVAWIKAAEALLRDIIAALEGQDDAEAVKLVRWARECEVSGHMEVYRDQLCDLIERQRLQLAEAERKLREAEEEVWRMYHYGAQNP